MSVDIDATVGGINANSFVTEDEALDYFAARLPLPTPWASVADQSAALVMATRFI